MAEQETLQAVLTPERFMTWLKSFEPRDYAGTPNDSHFCPLARYLESTVSEDDEHLIFVGRFQIQRDQESLMQEYDTEWPEWVTAFTRRVDGSARDVTVQEAIAIMDAVTRTANA